MIPVSPRIIALGAGALAVFAAGWLSNGWRLTSKYETEARKYAEAAAEVVKRREAENAEIRVQNQIEADRVRAKYRSSRVYVCPDVPGPGADPGQSGNDRPDREDIAPALRECLITLREVRALQTHVPAKPAQP